MRHRTAARFVLVLALGLLATGWALTSALAEDFTAPKVEKKWKVTLYHGNGSRPGQAPATRLPDGGIGMDFTPDPNTASGWASTPAARPSSSPSSPS